MSDVIRPDAGVGSPADMPTESMGPVPTEGAPPTERLGPVPSLPPVAPVPRPPRPRPPRGEAEARRRKVLLVVLAVLALLAGALVGVVVAGDGDDEPEPTTTSVTTSPPTSADTPATTSEVTTPPTTAVPTTVAPTTATTVAPTTPPVDTSTAVFPAASTGARFDDPVAAARAFAVDFVGFTDPLVGEFMQGDARSGEVEVRPTARGPVTTVFVRQLGADGSWWVLGSATTNVTLTTPAAGARITSPVTVRGAALAFEGNVGVEVRADGRPRPVGTGTVTAGGDEVRPFEGRITFTSPGEGHGSLLLLTHSGEDGRVWQAATLRVRF